MVKQTQTIRRLLLTNCLSVFDHFVGLALKGLMDLLFQVVEIPVCMLFNKRWTKRTAIKIKLTDDSFGEHSHE